MTADERGFLATLDTNPNDHTARAAYADWLDEQGRRYEAALERGRAGLSEVYFKIRRKSDGLFSEGAEPRGVKKWSALGKMWPKLHVLQAHLISYVKHHRPALRRDRCAVQRRHALERH
ncbi:TIGR02996 domain-containing protein [Gemmata sp. JC673]|uniref:TIGR02996 domain-containing protein n=1 Tax=Gemmata algarum TaxID=2975278 RepID=A0ABU5EXR8_9BACT|nr:TIGR02996 domain-containing protein [Gemmata algarum]MDY3558491.1 TIGR02996 domain-containing protein [Gemmata algarum]